MQTSAPLPNRKCSDRPLGDFNYVTFGRVILLVSLETLGTHTYEARA